MGIIFGKIKRKFGFKRKTRRPAKNGLPVPDGRWNEKRLAWQAVVFHGFVLPLLWMLTGRLPWFSGWRFCLSR